MKKLLSLTWLRVSIVVIAIVAIFGFATTWLVNHRYTKLLASSGLIETFLGSDGSAIETVARLNNLDYQKIVNYSVVSASNSDLPAPRFIEVATTISPTVIEQSSTTLLSRVRPYRVWLRNRYYIMIPVFPNGSQDGYLVYAKVI